MTFFIHPLKNTDECNQTLNIYYIYDMFVFKKFKIYNKNILLKKSKHSHCIILKLFLLNLNQIMLVSGIVLINCTFLCIYVLFIQ